MRSASHRDSSIGHARGPASALLLLVLAARPATAATTIHVPTDHPTIQTAIDAAAGGDTIIVSDGLYRENIDFKGKAITVRSANGPATTIIDGGSISCVVRFVTAETSSAVLSGFTIQHGRGADVCLFEGAGIFVDASSPTITGNVIADNEGCDGVGIGVGFGSPLIQGNLITRNHRSPSCSGGLGGGGISIRGASSAQIIGNTITANTMGNGIGGGGIALFSSGTAIVRGNLISGNTVETQGGGISLKFFSTAIITNNVITGNSATNGGGIAALVPDINTAAHIINNTIAGNTATGKGSQLYVDGTDSATQIWNNIMFGTSVQAAVVCDTTQSLTPPVLRFNDAFSTMGPAYAGSCADAASRDGNLSAMPRFVSAATDLHVVAASPVIDTGSSAAPDVPSTDFDGNPRVLDGNSDGTATIDMGAFEFASPRIGLGPTSLSFPAQIVGAPGVPQTVTVHNPGDAPIRISQIVATGDFAQTSTCGAVVAPGASCTIEVSFTATEIGDRTGTLTINDNVPGSPQSVALIGSGQDFAIEPAPGATASAEVDAGDTAVYPLQVAAADGFAGTVALTCTGAPEDADCTVSPAQLTLGGATTPFTVSVATSGSGKAAAGAAWSPGQRVGLVAILVALAWIAGSLVRRAAPSRRRRSLGVPAFVSVLVAGLAFSGCQHTDRMGTPAGTYELTITGTAGGQTRTLALPLTVR